MIRNEAEYKEAVQRLVAEEARIDAQREKLQAAKMSSAHMKRALDPLVSFHLQLREEVESYERLKRGDLGEIETLHGLGRVLVGVRIARGLTQKQLAELLGVHESQVSRDERNEYHGITVDRVSRILDVVDVQLTSRFEGPVVSISKKRKKTRAATGG